MCSSLLKGKISLALAYLCAFAFTASLTQAQTVVATVPLANSPSNVAVDPATKKVFVAVNYGVQVIDATTNTVIGSIVPPTSAPVVAVAVNPFNSVLYVGAEYGGLFMFDEKTNTQIEFANVNAASIAVNPATNVVWVSDFEGTVYAVDAKSGNINASVPVEAVENVAVNPFTNRVYAAQDLFPGKVAVIDGSTHQVIADVTGGGYLSFDVAVDPSRNVFYSTDQFGTLSVFNGANNTLTATVALPGQPTGIAVDPFTHRIYVSDYPDNTVDVVDGTTNTLVTTIAVGSSPEYSALNPANGLLYVGNTGASQNYDPAAETLSVIKTR